MSDNKQQINFAELQKVLAAMQQKKQAPENPQEPKQKRTLYDWIKLIIQSSIDLAKFMIHFVDRFINYISRSEDPERSDIMQYTRSPILFGGIIVFIFVFLGGIWATNAPLDSAAHATGTLISVSNKQIIQFSGTNRGIIKNILVKQGDKVKANDILVEFDETQVKQNYDIILNHYLQSLALESRLIAERDKHSKITFEPLMFQLQTPEVVKMMEVQTNTFNSRKENNDKIHTSYQKEIQKLNQKITALEENKKSTIKHQELLANRVKSFRDLVAKGYAAKNQLEEFEIKASAASSEIARVDSEIANAEQDIAKIEIGISRHEDEFMTSVLQELKDTQAKVNEWKERFAGAKDELERCKVRSPIDGVVNEVHVHTIGAVMTPSQQVAEVTPTKDKLIIDAKIQHNHIGSVVVGQKAKLKFLAFKSRTSPTFIGTVTSISPDTILDPQMAQQARMSGRSPSGGYYYAATIELDMENFEKLATPMKLKLVPGMMADINIVTGTRTLFRYLIDPIADQAFRSLNEK